MFFRWFSKVFLGMYEDLFAQPMAILASLHKILYMKQVFIILALIAFLTSCSNDIDDKLTTPLEGKWTLTNVSCFCGFGNNPDFSGHKITFVGNNLEIENTGEFKFLIDAAGAYTVQGNMIKLKNGRQYTYTVKTDILELTFVDNPQIADDEIFMVYKRG